MEETQHSMGEGAARDTARRLRRLLVQVEGSMFYPRSTPMLHSRRQLLQSLALGSGTALFTGCERAVTEITQQLGQRVPVQLEPCAGSEIDADFHLLSRAAFSPWPGDLVRLKKLGRAAWIEQQLRPESIDDSLCEARVAWFESIRESIGDAYDYRKEVLRDELTRHALLRAVYSQRQLFEVMVEFWTDHLNIDLEKGDCFYLKPSDDREVIRQHALGNFYDLIRASATSPAMLVYLDGKSNKVRQGTDDKPNENYARELMELHTLGVHGGYSQADVGEAARCLSGWTFDPKRLLAMDVDKAFFRTDWHDHGQKTVLGQVIESDTADGSGELDALVRVVCNHPSTAKFIATKLCRRFVAYDAPASLVERVAAEFTKTDGDIKALLRVILGSEEFASARGTLLKRPFRFVVSALRLFGAETHAHANGSIIQALARMGHGLFQYPTPDGYPDEEMPWMGTLMWRWNFALGLADNKLYDVSVPLESLANALHAHPSDGAAWVKWFEHLHGRAPSETERAAMEPLAAANAEEAPSSSSRQPRQPRRPARPPIDASHRELLGLLVAGPAFQRC